MSLVPIRSPRLSRRALVGSSLVGAAALPLRTVPHALADHIRPAPASTGSSSSPLPSPAGWRTWLLTSPDELRPPAPGTPTTGDIEAILEIQSGPTDEQSTAIATWGTGPAVVPWSALVAELFNEFSVSGMRQCRNMALLHTAIHDAAIAAWDAQAAYTRPSPAATDNRITPSGAVDPAIPTFPSAHAAIAGAAATVLTYLLPDADQGRFDRLAEEAAMSRFWAGAAFLSDVQVGLALGRAVGDKAVARGKADGSDAMFDPATMPSGPGFWQPTPPAHADPLEPLGGTWKPWVMSSGDQFRPAPPPEYGSPAWRAELATVKEVVANRTPQMKSEAAWWQTEGTFVIFTGWAHELIARAGLDLPQAARVLADLNVAYADAVTAVWDAKYTWWTPRPITEAPELVTAFPTPPYPAYPSGYSAVAGAAAIVLGHYFPDAAEEIADSAWRAAKSRAWAGIHYMIDNEIGLSMGRQVGRLICDLDRADTAGAE